jgi:hypothetical protein
MLNLQLIGIIFEPNKVLVIAASDSKNLLGTETSGGKEFIVTEGDNGGFNIALEGDAK